MDPSTLVNDAEYTLTLEGEEHEAIFLYPSANYYNFLTPRGILKMSDSQLKSTICKTNGTSTGSSSKNATPS